MSAAAEIMSSWHLGEKSTILAAFHVWDHTASITFCPRAPLAHISYFAFWNTGCVHAYFNRQITEHNFLWSPYLLQRSVLGWHTWPVKLVVRNMMLEVWILFPNTRVLKWVRAHSATGWNATRFIQGPSFFSGLGLYFPSFSVLLFNL